MKILKIRDVKTPTRGTEKSAGLDFYIPNDYGEEFETEDEGIITLPPLASINIPSGIKVKVPKGFALIAMNKSGVALRGLQVGACVIDEDYQGEIHLHVRNISSETRFWYPGDKLVQMLLVPVSYANVEEVNSEEELYPEGKTERGSGGFGSTGLK